MSSGGSSTDRVVRVVNDPINRFYELTVDGTYAGILVYEVAATRYVLTHTYIEEAFRGEGLVTTLIREALDDLQAKDVTVTNYCPIVDRFIHKNPDYGTLIGSSQTGSRTASAGDTSTMAADLDTAGRRRIQAHSQMRAATE